MPYQNNNNNNSNDDNNIKDTVEIKDTIYYYILVVMIIIIICPIIMMMKINYDCHCSHLLTGMHIPVLKNHQDTTRWTTRTRITALNSTRIPSQDVRLDRESARSGLISLV